MNGICLSDLKQKIEEANDETVNHLGNPVIG